MKKFFCASLIIVLMFTNGCVMKKEQELKSKDYIVYNMNKYPKDLLMIDNDKVREKDMLLAFFEGLVREEQNGDIVPGLAEEWEASSDKLGYIFKLRKDIFWSNGEEIKASDFVTFFYDFLSYKDNIYANQLDCIYGAKEFREGRCDFDKVAISAVDDKTLQIRLNYSNSYFLKLLSQPIFTLRDKTYLEDWEKNYKKIKFSGPFVIEEINGEKQFLIIKNKKYWRSKDIKNNKILVTSVEESEKALAKLESKNPNDMYGIDILIDPPVSEQMRLSEQGKLISMRNETVFGIDFNLKKDSIVNDINFRKAVNLAISKEHIVQSISKELATPAVAYIPSSSYTSLNENITEEKYFDVYGNRYKAKEFLDKSNYNKNDKIKLIYENNSLNNRICEALVENLEEYLNIEIISKACNKQELDELINNGDYDIIQNQYSGDYDDEATFLKNCISNSRNNMSGYKNLKLDTLIHKVEMEDNKDKKKYLSEQAQQILKDELPIIPIYYMNTVICKRNNIEGVYATKKGNIKFDYVHKKAEKLIINNR